MSMLTALAGTAAWFAIAAWFVSYSTREEVRNMAEEIEAIAEISGAVYDSVLAIGEQLLAADPGDKEQIVQLQAQYKAELAKSEAFRDPERLARTQAFLDAAAAATPPEG